MKNTCEEPNENDRYLKPTKCRDLSIDIGTKRRKEDR